MKRFIIKALVLLNILVLSGGCVSMATVEKGPTIQQKMMATESGLSLRYSVSLPSSFSSDRSFPLILALHYGGQVTPFYGGEFLSFLVEPALRGLEAIIVAPDCPARTWNNPASEAALMALLNQVRKDYSIDNKKILITGYSLGAVGVWYLVLKQPHFFSAAIPISGLPPKETVLVETKTPFYVIHSQDDEIFPVDSVKSFLQEAKSKGISVHFELVEGKSHYDTAEFIQPLKSVVPWVKKVWKE